METRNRKYSETHPWITFALDLAKASPKLWMALGEAQSKCAHVAGVPIKPAIAKLLHTIYLAKGIHATTAIEGNTLSEKDVIAHINGTLKVPSSQSYMQKEIDNILVACNEILSELQSGSVAPLSCQLIKRYNFLVLNGLTLADEDVVPGQIRKDRRIVGRYLGAPSEDCEYLIDRLCEWLNSFPLQPGHELVCGLVKAIVAHIYIAWIHPFGDGNGRTARLIEFRTVLEAGAPSNAAHLLSNHYNGTRMEYTRQLDRASQSGGDILPFIEYAVDGFIEGLREHLDVIKLQQLDVAWTDYVHEVFRNKKSMAEQRQRKLVLALSRENQPKKRHEIRHLSPELAEEYAGKTPKTVSRDLNAVCELKLVEETPEGYVATRGTILAFLPIRHEHEEDKIIKEWSQESETQLDLAL